VELHGTFYPARKAKPACVILLHKYGGNRQQQGWKELAEVLTKEFAVLSFDFRGHGDSTNVSPEFWRSRLNLSMIKGGTRQPSKISHKDFHSNYIPVLANDVAAAKRYLDRQNDAGSCNSSNVIVIGAEEGAAIGALWIASEWERRRSVKNAFGWTYDPKRVEGEDIASAAWLSIPKTLVGAPVGNWLRGRGNNIRDKVPMVFFYGDKDYKSVAAAQALYDELKRAGREKLELTKTRAKDTGLAGNGLLGKKSLGTEDEIFNYLDKVMQKRGMKAPIQRDVENSPVPNLIPLQAFGIR
jgi:hypothetical protein